jgi:hypothetical protein
LHDRYSSLRSKLSLGACSVLIESEPGSSFLF